MHLAIYASPRENGFSSGAHDILISAQKKNGLNVEIIKTWSADIKPCSSCGFCKLNTGCEISDEMSEFYPMIKNSSSISISTPLYFSSVPGPLKNFIDRGQTFWEEKRRGEIQKPKTGALIISAGAPLKKRPDHAVAVIKHFFNTINCSLRDENVLIIDGTDEKTGISPEIRLRLESLSIS